MEQLKDKKLRFELSEHEIADLEAVVDIMAAGNPMIDPSSLLCYPSTPNKALLANLLQPSNAEEAHKPAETSSVLASSNSATLPLHPPIELLRELRMRKFCPEETRLDNTIDSPASALKCEENLDDMETAASQNLPVIMSPTNSPKSLSSTTSSMSQPSSPLFDYQHFEKAESTPVSPGHTSSSPSVAAPNASSLLMKSDLPEAAYIPLSDVDSTKLTYLLERLQEVIQNVKMAAK